MAQDEIQHKQLTQLIQRLSCDDLDEHEVKGIVSLCLEAMRDPASMLAANYGEEASQIAQYDPNGVVAFVVFTELEDYFAVADTVDELHEQIIAAFDTPTLPEYPYDNNQFETVADYFAWLDEQLLIHHAKYRLIEFGQSYTHDFQTILVLRDTVDELLQLCNDLGIAALPCPASEQTD